MAYELLGLNELETVKVTNHLSSASTGIKQHGLALDAIANGLIEGFQGKSLIEFAAGAYVVAAASVKVLTINKTYVINGSNQTMFVSTSNAADSVKAPAFAATSGLVNAASTDHSVFRVVCDNTDSDTTGCVAVIDQGSILWVPPSNNFKLGFEVAAWDNRTQDRLFVMSQIGVCGALHANKLVLDSAAMDDGTNPISGGNFLYVELAADRIRIVHGNSTTAPTLGTQYEVPSGAFSVMLAYVAASNSVQLYVDNRYISTTVLEQWTTSGALQFFMRAGNSTGYDDATMLPCDISIDSVILPCPRS